MDFLAITSLLKPAISKYFYGARLTALLKTVLKKGNKEK